MATSGVSSDEGEIVEASPLPRSNQDGDVDRAGRHPGRRYSRTPDGDVPRYDREGSQRRSRSPRGFKRPRDDRDRDRDRDRRDPRQFRVHYEDRRDSRDYRDSRDDRRHYHDLDRPVSRGSSHNEDWSAHRTRPSNGVHYDDRDRDRGYDRDRNFDSHPAKRNRNRSRSPRNRRGGGGDRDRSRRDRGRYGPDFVPEENKYSAHNERRSQDDSTSKRATPVEHSGNGSGHHAKSDQGVTVERGINGLAISRNG